MPCLLDCTYVHYVALYHTPYIVAIVECICVRSNIASLDWVYNRCFLKSIINHPKAMKKTNARYYYIVLLLQKR